MPSEFNASGASPEDSRLETLELKLMDMELAQQVIDGVVLAQSNEIAELRLALGRLETRLAAADRLDAGAAMHELPPHY